MTSTIFYSLDVYGLLSPHSINSLCSSPYVFLYICSASTV